MEYVEDRYDSLVWLPNKLIKIALDEGLENSLAYFILLKKIYKKAIFYNYTLKKVSDLINCSPACLSRHIAILIKLGCITITDGHLHLTGSKKLQDRYKSIFVAVKYAETKKEIIANIRYTKYKRNFHRQIKINEIRTDIIKMHKGTKHFNYEETKRLLKIEKRFYPDSVKLEKNLCDGLLLSNEKFGCLVNRSKSTGIRIQKQLNSLGIIQSTRNFEFYSNDKYGRRAFFELNLGSNYRLSAKGYIYRILPNRISLLTPVQEV